MDTTQHLLDTIYKEIPMSRLMGFGIEELTNASISAYAPLADNRNIHNTAFAGSLYSVCALTGWSFLYHHLQQQKCHASLVISKGEMRYLKPVTTDIKTHCNIANDSDAIEKFIDTYNKKGIAYLSLIVSVKDKSRVAAEFIGEFAATKNQIGASIKLHD